MPRRLRIIAVVAGYLAAACAFTWPIAARMGQGIWGRSWDAVNNLWFFEFVKHSMIARGEWSLQTTRVFFPFGYDLRADLAHFLLPLLSVPLQSFMRVEATYNLLLLLSLTFSGCAAYVLARRFTENRLAAFAAGILWVVNPVAVREIAAGSLEVACGGFFVLAFVALLRLRENPSISRAAQLAGVWFLAGLTNWVMAGMFGLVLVFSAPFLIRSKDKSSGKTLAALLAAVLVATSIAALPFVGPLVKGGELSINEEDISLARITPDAETARRIGSARESSLMSYASDSLDAGDLLVAQDMSNPAAPLAWWLLLVPALLSLADSKRRKTWLVAGGFVFMILAMGPFLRWFDHFHFGRNQLSIPLPAWLAYKIVPGFHLFYRPYRFVFPALLLFVGPIAGQFSALIQLGKKKWTRGIIGASLVSGCLVAGLAGFHGGGGAFNSLYISNEYRTVIGELKPARALIDVPFYPLPVSLVNAHAMLAQTYHSIPIFNATHLRLTGWRRFAKFIEHNSAAAALLDLQLKKPGPYVVDTDSARRLADMGFDLIVVHTSFFTDDPSTDRYRRMPHELFMLLDRLYGDPLALEMGFCYKTGEIAQGKVVSVDDNAAARLRFARQYFMPAVYREPVGYVSTETKRDGNSETLRFSTPGHVSPDDEFCGWFRFKASQHLPERVWLESGFDDAQHIAAFKLELPFDSAPKWKRHCFQNSDWKTDDGDRTLEPSLLSWLRIRQDGGDPIIIDMDDLAFVPGGDEV